MPPHPSPTQKTQTERRVMRAITIGAALLGALMIVASIAVPGEPDDDADLQAALPNPMGGAARTAPGQASGSVSLAGLEIDDVEVAMGDVALGVTYVPGWEVNNPTGAALTIAAGQPQVLEGCCPGPVYANGELVQVGEELTVSPGGSLLLQFPLQMHAGMDGPHHLAVPLFAAGEQVAVHVTGNFTSTASAS